MVRGRYPGQPVDSRTGADGFDCGTDGADADREPHERVTVQTRAREHEWKQVRARRTAAKTHRAEAATAQPADDVPAAPVAPVVLPAPRAGERSAAVAVAGELGGATCADVAMSAKTVQRRPRCAPSWLSWTATPF